MSRYEINLDAKNEEHRKVRELIAKANAEAREHWLDQGWRAEMLKDITELVFWGFQHENLLQYLTTVENADIGEPITVEEVRGLTVYWTSLGGQIDQSSVTERVWELRPDLVGFHVSEFERHIRTRFAKYQDRIVDLAIQQMDAAINSRVLSLFETAIPNNSSPYYVSAAGVDKALVDNAITEVSDETLGDSVTIVGRATMIDKLMSEIEGTGLFTPQSNEQLLTLGFIGKYKSANVVKLKNFKDRHDVSFVPGNEMFVVGVDASKTGFWGGLDAQEYTDHARYWNYEATREAGFALHHPERVRRYVDTSQ